MRKEVVGLLGLLTSSTAQAADWKVIHKSSDNTVFLADFDSAQALGTIATFWLKIDSRLAERGKGGVYVMKTELHCVPRTWGWLAWSDYDFSEKLKASKTQNTAEQIPIEPETAMDFVRRQICEEMSIKALNMKRQEAQGTLRH